MRRSNPATQSAAASAFETLLSLSPTNALGINEMINQKTGQSVATKLVEGKAEELLTKGGKMTDENIRQGFGPDTFVRYVDVCFQKGYRPEMQGEEELKLMLSLVRPRHFVPVHGEYRQLSQHARLAARVFAGRAPKPEILLAENGDLIQFEGDSIRVAGKAPVGRILIDGTRTGEVADEVLRDRRHLAEDGLVVPVVAINRQTGKVEGLPDVITRGFVRDESLMREAPDHVVEIIASASIEERKDPGLIREKLRNDLQRVFRRRSGGRPLIVPVIMEI
jgi:mRNA degradation ribonuclease J1/J2